ncbi:hypothetical protein DFH08DRAFT_968672 [Mycena albidolilacea]|uniref:Uncharacterized protein n=1 Tax=Mycena albidolilacea TaxID=1033008 RepID=A0AAD7EHU1_9AGAR|nr:hypothetical protein DFH08DRAFT_968672 [Mycena albidolilacea]
MSTEKSFRYSSRLASSTVIAYIDIFCDSPWFYIWGVLEPMGNQISGMYPTLIIVIANFQRTIWEESPSTINNSLQWRSSIKPSGPTDTFGTQRGVDIRLDTVLEISREKSMGKEPPSGAV